LLAGCRTQERAARRLQAKKIEVLSEFQSLIQLHPEWVDSLGPKPRVDTLYIPKVEYITKVQTRVDTVTIIQQIDTLSQQLFGTIDNLQAQLLRRTVLNIAAQSAARSLPDTTIRFSRRLLVELNGKTITVQDTLSVTIKAEGPGYILKVGNQEKHIPVQTVSHPVTIKPVASCEDKFYHHKEFWACFALCLLGWWLALKR
jgi:hypothetical protein